MKQFIFTITIALIIFVIFTPLMKISANSTDIEGRFTQNSLSDFIFNEQTTNFSLLDNIGWEELGSGSATEGGISDNIGLSNAPSISLAPDGTAYIAWQDDTSGDSEIYVKKWNGSSWVEVGSGSASSGGVSNNDGESETPSIAIAPDGSPYVAWMDDSGGVTHQIYIRLWDGNRWTEVGTDSATNGGISNNHFVDGGPSIAISPDGIPYVAWVDSSLGDSEIYIKKWNGSYWAEVGTGSASGGGISDNDRYSWQPSVTISPEGTPYVAWMDYSGGGAQIYVRRWNGNIWEEIGLMSASYGGISNCGQSENPAIAVALDGTPYVTWRAEHQDGDASRWNIYVRRWDGSSWEEVGSGSATAGGISANIGTSTNPSIAIDSNHKVYVTWQDSSSGNIEIYVKRWDGSSWVEVGAGSASGGGISNNIGQSWNPSLAISQSNIPYITWTDTSSGGQDIYVRRFTGDLEPGDTIPPSVINDLTARSGSVSGTVDLKWTAPGDDGKIGISSEYIVRYAEFEINTEYAWHGAENISGVQSPSPAGTEESFFVSGLTPGAIYHFAVRALDEAGNISDLSNNASAMAETVYPRVHNIGHYNHLEWEYPCGPTYNLLPIPDDFPLVDTRLYFSVTKPEQIKDIYLVISGKPSKHRSLDALKTDEEGIYLWAISEYDLTDTVWDLFKLLSELFACIASKGTICTLGTTLSPNDLTNKNIATDFGELEQIVVVTKDGIEYAFPTDITIKTIHDRTLVAKQKPECDISDGSICFGARCDQYYVRNYSPVDILLTDPTGNIAGNTSSGIKLDIPDCFYSGPGVEEEFLVVYSPLPGTWGLEAVGTGNGEFDLLNYHHSADSSRRVGSYLRDISISEGEVKSYTLDIPLRKIRLPFVMNKFESHAIPTPTPTATRTPTHTTTPTNTFTPTPSLTDTPSPNTVDVMLVIDRSGSMSGTLLDDAKEANKVFIDELSLPPDQVGVVSFASTASLDHQLSVDDQSIKSAIEGLVGSGVTYLADGINTAQNELTSSRHDPNNISIMILLSDGKSIDDPIAAAKYAKSAGTIIFSIGLGEFADEVTLKAVASGLDYYYFAPTSNELNYIYKQIAWRLSIVNMVNSAVVE
jgi:uncharacterized protein YegL